MPEFDVSEASTRRNSRIVKTAVTPRPIAWVSSRSSDGVDNLAPFSSSNYLVSHRPVVMFNASHHGDGRLKDSARNAIDTGEFAVNVATEELLGSMDATSESVPADVNEFDLAGVEAAPCRTIDAPRVAEAAVSMECTLHDTLEVYDRVIVLGDVTYFHVDEAVTTDGKIDAHKMDTVGRLGGPHYTISEPLAFDRQH